MAAVVKATHPQGIVGCGPAAGARAQNEYDDRTKQHLAAQSLGQKGRWLQAPHRKSFGKVSPLCQEVLRAAVRNAQVRSKPMTCEA